MKNLALLALIALVIPSHSFAKDGKAQNQNTESQNLRSGLIGNGTGIGTEDTTSKDMTDNNTLADPKAGNQALGVVETGALSAPVQSGTTGDAGHKHGKMGHTQGQMDDAQFLDKFTQHHKDGIKMAEMAVEKAQSPELKKMAEKMVKDQNEEVDQMQKWRNDLYASVEDTDASVPKMDMSPLENAEGAEFDRQFATMMAKHHEDGISMAKAAAPKIENKQVKQFAQNAVKNQSKEKQHLAKHAKSVGTASGTTKAQ